MSTQSSETLPAWDVTGSVLIGSEDVQTGAKFHAIAPATGEPLAPAISSTAPAHIATACALAEEAFTSFSETPCEERARFLEQIAANVEALGDPLIERAVAETGLARARLEGERGRTAGQLRMFASLVRRGEWVRATVDPALPDRKPLPRPDIRRRHVAIGPVAVFGASNFPLAFSVAGGDTASALAAGCPVVVKGHPAHPGTGELMARAIRAAVRTCGFHEGVFSYLPGAGHELGAALVADARIKAVGFTGSRAGGLALVRIAQERPEPIPVFAEMSSVNPVLLFPTALATRAEELGSAFIQSLTMGAGQFCTNPGLVLGVGGPGLDRFADAAAKALSDSTPQTMLTPDIRAGFEQGVDQLSQRAGVTTVGRESIGESVNQACGALFRADSDSFIADPALSQEVFGASALIVACRDLDDMERVVGRLEGQLTATLIIDPEDEPAAAGFVPLLENKAGRILANGWPTGVEVCDAMVHGGPFPATSDARTTSVGTLAIERFLRPVCYQNLPQSLLPPTLRDGASVPQRVNGKPA